MSWPIWHDVLETTKYPEFVLTTDLVNLNQKSVQITQRLQDDKTESAKILTSFCLFSFV